MSEQISTPNGDKPHNPGNSRSKPRTPRWKQTLARLAVPLLLILAALLIWMYLPAIKEAVVGTATPSELPPSPSPSATLAADTPTPAPTFPPTATIMPPSAYRKDPAAIDPKIPGLALDAVVLNDDTSVTADPPFDQLQWYSSKQISEQIGRIINEPFHATVGAGTVVWKMDVPLQPGLYEIYILDTVYSSAGALDFRVMLGDRELVPLLGNQHLQYSAQAGNPSQRSDQWAYLGLYDLDTADLLSVLTTWDTRDMSTIVAIDRVLIAKQPDSLRDLIGQLPANMPKYVIDDAAAQIDSSGTWYTRSDLPAWGSSFQSVMSPEYSSQITWQVPGLVPTGSYDIWVWVPEMQGEADLTFKILINGEENQGTLIANTENIPQNQWVSLGTWQVNVEYSDHAELGLSMTIPRGATGEIGVDAVAFIARQ